MAEVWTEPSGGRKENAKLRVARIAGRHQGRITTAQLRAIGVGEATISRWQSAGYLHHTRLPKVYAVGTPARTVESDLWEAILYAGPGAMLSHGTATWWRGLIDYPVRPIHVSTPRRKRSLPGIAVHGRRDGLERAEHRGMPVTTVADTMLDLAALDEELLVRRALAKLDFAHSVDAPAIRAVCGQGRAGSALLEWAIRHYEPLFAYTQSWFEDRYLELCEETNTKKPDRMSEKVLGIPCDAIYEHERVIVELDGADNHSSPAQMRRDRRNDMRLRAAGWLVLRYTTEQMVQDTEAMFSEIQSVLAERAGLAV